MSKLNTELFVARRLGGSGGGESKGVMVRIAVATTAVSLAVMIVAVAVIMGFRAEISGKITAFTGHLKVQALDYGSGVESAPITLSAGVERDVASLPGVRSIAPYALKIGLVKTDEATQGVILKGVDASYDLSLFEEWLVEGSLPRITDSVRHKDILLSASVGRIMRLGTGDRVEMLFISDDRPPRRDRFSVCGLYSSGFEEMDGNFAITDMAGVRRLNGWNESQATGYEIVLDDMERLGELEAQLVETILPYDTGEPPLMVRSVTGDFPQLFDWLATHDVNAAVIIAIMIVVALVSMISALLIILLERIRMIGVLKTLGMTNGALRRIFVMRAAGIVLWGLLIGNIVGIGFALVQQFTGFIPLNEAGYGLSRVPIALDAWWIGNTHRTCRADDISYGHGKSHNSRKNGTLPVMDGSRKKQRVGEMFDDIAPTYDALNHFLSLGIDRGWRRKVVKMAARCHPRAILDVATGTGDLALALVRRIPSARVTGVDISENMLAQGREKVNRRGLKEKIVMQSGDAEALEFETGTFDCVTVAFGVRNFGDIPVGLREMYRVLRPGGRCLVLEFSEPTAPVFGWIYSFYFHRVLPWMGRLVSRNRTAYSYLPRSVDEFPLPERFSEMLKEAGFAGVRTEKLTFGVAYIYEAIK